MNDRKYRHQGYMGSEEPSGPRRSGPRPPRPEGPRGRGADQNKDVVFACRSCGEKHRDFEEVGPDSTCVKCGADLHACAQCANFDTSARWECTEQIPARIPSKKLRNACLLYTPARSFDLSGARASGGTPTPDGARAAFDALFKK